MTNIELVIRIPEEIRLALINNIQLSPDQQSICDSYVKHAVINGTPLPKGHGVLKDVTNLMRGLYTDMQTIEETFTSSDVYKMIDEECPTIIEAD